jgi:hypothetical protein
MLKEYSQEEKIKILSKEVSRQISLQAAYVMPLIEKYGDEAVQHVKKELRKSMVSYYKGRFEAEGIEGGGLDDFHEFFMKEVIAPVAIMGTQGGVIVEKTKKKMVTRDTKCTTLNSWKTFTDKPWIMCDIESEVEQGMAEAMNSKMIYTQYSGPKVKGKTQWGLSKGKPCCEFIMEMKD